VRLKERVFCSTLALALSGLLTSSEASAEVFHYVDRAGHSHPVTVSARAPEGGSLPPAAAPLAAAAPPLPAAPVAEAPPSTDFTPPAAAPLPMFAAAPAPAATPAALLPVAFLPIETDSSFIPYFALVQQASEAYGLPPELILAVMKVESNFNPRAVSRSGAQGLMQLMPATAAALGVTDPFDPRQSIVGGAYTLRVLVNEFDGQVPLAVAAYNAGSKAVRRHGGVPPIPETQSYVPTVLFLYRSYLANGIARRAAAAPAVRPSEARAW
jgi:soluble lytic murein transglycosylase-like protein